MKAISIDVYRYIQNDQEFLGAVLPFGLINKMSEVLIYGKTDYGYQREPVRDHYQKIKRYLLDNRGAAILPTSIILSADKDDIDNLLFSNNGNLRLKLDMRSEEKIFRIVDGQHRLRGMEEAAKTDGRYYDFMLNVIILLTRPLRRSIELSVFTDINSKSKRIKVDLAELAKHNYELLEKKIENLNRHISIKVGYRLKEDNPRSVWHKGIKFDIHSDIVLGIVGVTAFCESIAPLVNVYLNKKQPSSNLSPAGAIHYTEDAARDIAAFVDNAWEIIASKWSHCFKKDFVQDMDGEVVELFYNSNYYIQKTIGVKALNGILGEIVQGIGLSDTALKEFKHIISGSKLKSDDWLVGATLAGLSSESGVKKIRGIIKNEIKP